MLVLIFVLVLSMGIGAALAARPTRTALEVTITSPPDGLEVAQEDIFTVEGLVIARNGDAGLVETFVQYAIGDGATDFRNVDGANLQILSGLQPQAQSLLKDQQYIVSWTLSGSPGVYEIRILSQGATAKSGTSVSRTVIIIPEPIPGVELVDSEYRDSSIGYGSATGTYANTFYSDDVYEVLSEGINAHGTKKTGDDTSELGWVYEFSGLSPRLDTMLYIECHAVFPSGDPIYEGFVVQAEYQGMWFEVVGIDLPAAGKVYSADLPDDNCQSIRLRIADIDRTVGDRVKSLLYIDHLYIDTAGFEVVNPGRELLFGGYYDAFSVSSWEYEADTNAWFYDRSFPLKNFGWGLVEEVLVIDVDGDGDLETITGGSGDYIQIFECINGAMVPVHTIAHPGTGFEVIRSIAAADLDGDNGPDLELLVSSSNFDIQTAIFKMIDGVYVPVFTISSNDPRPIGGTACAIGDIDGDPDLEFVVTEEYPELDGVSLLRLFDFVGGTWQEMADYSLELRPTMGNWIHTVQMVDVDNDGANEIFVDQYDSPVQVLEYSDGQLVKAWQAPFQAAPGIRERGGIAGDFTNDGNADIVVAFGQFDPEADTSLFMVYEFVGNTFTNTFNFTGPAFYSCGDNSLKIGDIDADGLNELVFVYSINVDTSAQRSLFSVFRNGLLLFTGDTGYRDSQVVAIGDYDNDAI